INTGRVRVRCIGEGRKILGERVVDLSNFDDLPDAFEAQSVQMKTEDGTTVELIGPGASIRTAEDGTQFFWMPEDGSGTMVVKGPNGEPIEARKPIFVPAGDKALEELATLLNDEIERLSGFANNKTTYTAPEQVVADLRSVVERCTDLMSKKEWQEEDYLRWALNALVTSLSKATAIMATPRSNDDVFILFREILTPKLINEVVVDLQYVLNVNAPIAQKETGNALDVQKKGTVDGTFTIRTGGSAEGTLFISGGTATGTGGTITAAPIVVGKGGTTFWEMEILNEQGAPVEPHQKMIYIKDYLGKANKYLQPVRSFNFVDPTNQFASVPPSDMTLLGGTLTLSPDGLSGNVSGYGEVKPLPADRFTFSTDGIAELQVYGGELAELYAECVKKLGMSMSSARTASARASADDEAEEEPFILTVSVRARRTDTGAEGVTVASVPVVIVSDGGGGGSSGGCDAGLGALAVIACAALALARRRG
ncbi:MAG: hypothetical protein IJR14_10735, partial [Synergistaceae bacterium]|nr:hypothetical protein [Synergistaceae bacterium]